MSKPLAAIVGWYYKKPGQFWDLSLTKFMHQTVIELADSFQDSVRREMNPKYEIHRRDVDAVYLSSGTASLIGRGGQRSWESLFSSKFGSIHEVHTSGKGLTALHEAVRTIRVGDADLIMVVGVDKRSDEQVTGDISNQSVDPTLRLWDWKWQSLYADAFVEYMRQNELGQVELHDMLMDCAFNDLYNAGKIKLDQKIREKMKKDAYKRLSYDPLTDSDFAKTNLDGAAALILTNVEDAKKYTETPVYITGSMSQTGSSEVWNNETTNLPALVKCTEKLYNRYNLKYTDLDFVSIDTKSTMAMPIILESMNLLPTPAVKYISETIDARIEGEASDKKLRYNGLVVNPCGGTYSLGNSPGATGIYRTVYNSQNLLRSNRCCGIIQEHSGAGASQTLMSLEVKK
jgi:acetyl-CoA C-acetyltransferase